MSALAIRHVARRAARRAHAGGKVFSLRHRDCHSGVPHSRGCIRGCIERRAIAFSLVGRFAMTLKGVLPVRGVEVLCDGRFISPIPAVSP